MFGDLKITFHAVSGDTTPLVVTINNFPALPRQDLQSLQSEINFVASGNALIGGTSFEMRPIFIIDSWLTQEKCEALSAMWAIREKRRRANGYWAFFVDDETQLFYEEATASTKTRSSVSGTAVIEKNKGCYYYPRFKVDMPNAPEFGKPTRAGYQQAIFVLQELGVKI